MSQPIYKRVLLKLSGEALTKSSQMGIAHQLVDNIIQEVLSIAALDVQVGLVIGAGNWMRGRDFDDPRMRLTADCQGMLATIINALTIRDIFLSKNHQAKIYSAIAVEGVVEKFNRYNAICDLNNNHVLIFAGGTGNPRVTTDSAASLRAIEIHADVLLKATTVDGVYTADPNKHEDAKLISNLSYDEVLANEYGVMDLTAFTQCRDNNMPIRIFNMGKTGVLKSIVCGDTVGTTIGSK